MRCSRAGRRAEKADQKRSQNLRIADARTAKLERFLHKVRKTSGCCLIPPIGSFEPAAECLDWEQTFSILSEPIFRKTFNSSDHHLPFKATYPCKLLDERTVLPDLPFPGPSMIRESGTKLRGLPPLWCFQLPHRVNSASEISRIGRYIWNRRIVFVERSQ